MCRTKFFVLKRSTSVSEKKQKHSRALGNKIIKYKDKNYRPFNLCRTKDIKILGEIQDLVPTKVKHETSNLR